MRDRIYLAWRYIAYNRIKTGILVLSIGLIGFLPVGLKVLVNHSSESLLARAGTTPLVIGEKGSELELVLNSLYFQADTPPDFPYAEFQRVINSSLTHAIPIYNRFQAGDFPIVGTTIDYFQFRDLQLAQGRSMALLGECVVGSRVAESLELQPGSFVISTPESVFDLAGIYPLKMQVVGVLEATGTPDDKAVFTDLKTAWIIAGLAHGHEDLSTPEAAGNVLKREDGNIVANAAVMQYNEITEANRESFHLHGDPMAFPITAIIAFPHDKKSGALLQGQYLGEKELMQVISPTQVVSELLGVVLTIQNYILAGAIIAIGSMAATAILIFMLSLRIRKREIETMHRIGIPKRNVLVLLVTEIAVVLVLSMILAFSLTLVLARFGESIIQNILL